MIRGGTKVTWKWETGTACGKVKDIFDQKISTNIKGTEVTRN